MQDGPVLQNPMAVAGAVAAKNRHSRLQPPNAMRFHPNRSLGETSRTAKCRLGHHIRFALAALDGALRKVVVPRGLFFLVSWANDQDDAGGCTIDR
jgi:hypothetical protein